MSENAEVQAEVTRILQECDEARKTGIKQGLVAVVVVAGGFLVCRRVARAAARKLNKASEQ